MKTIKTKLNAAREFGTATSQRIASWHYLSRIGLIYAGKGNLGDAVMIKATQHLLPQAKLFQFLHPKQEHRLTRLGLSGQEYFNSVILGGGTLINPFWAKQVRVALDQGLVLWSLGTGVGSCGYPQPSTVELAEWKPLLADFQRIGVRGPRSKAALEAIGINNVEVIGDLALIFTQDSMKQAIFSDPPRFAINVMLQPNEDGVREQKYLQDLELAVRELIQRGWQPLPIALHPSDVYALKQLMQRLSMQHLPIPVLKTAESFFQIVSSCSFTIGTRLHSAVLSSCVGVPPLMFGYRDKCLDFMESMQLETWHISIQNAKPREITEKALFLSEVAPSLRPAILARSQSWKNQIEKYVEDLVPQRTLEISVT